MCMAQRTNVTDLPKLLALVASFCVKFPPVNIFIITISTFFNKHKKQKSEIVENIENLMLFQQVFNNRIFSTKSLKNRKNRKKLLKTLLKSIFQHFQQGK